MDPSSSSAKRRNVMEEDKSDGTVVNQSRMANPFPNMGQWLQLRPAELPTAEPEIQSQSQTDSYYSHDVNVEGGKKSPELRQRGLQIDNVTEQTHGALVSGQHQVKSMVGLWGGEEIKDYKKRPSKKSTQFLMTTPSKQNGGPTARVDSMDPSSSSAKKRKVMEEDNQSRMRRVLQIKLEKVTLVEPEIQSQTDSYYSHDVNVEGGKKSPELRRRGLQIDNVTEQSHGALVSDDYKEESTCTPVQPSTQTEVSPNPSSQSLLEAIQAITFGTNVGASTTSYQSVNLSNVKNVTAVPQCDQPDTIAHGGLPVCQVPNRQSRPFQDAARGDGSIGGLSNTIRSHDWDPLMNQGNTRDTFMRDKKYEQLPSHFDFEMPKDFDF